MPTVFGLGLLGWIAARGRLSDGSMTAIVILAALHVLGARYIYSNVPYDAWTDAVLGVRLGESLGFQRNQYDRFVHFLFGALGVIPLREVLRRLGIGSCRGRALLAVGAVLSISALYEVFEWTLTWTVPPDEALRYNGQQGDAWDAQKDMALALSGAVLSSLLAWGGPRRTSRGRTGG